MHQAGTRLPELYRLALIIRLPRRCSFLHSLIVLSCDVLQARIEHQPRECLACSLLIGQAWKEGTQQRQNDGPGETTDERSVARQPRAWSCSRVKGIDR